MQPHSVATFLRKNPPNKSPNSASSCKLQQARQKLQVVAVANKSSSQKVIKKLTMSDHGIPFLDLGIQSQDGT